MWYGAKHVSISWTVWAWLTSVTDRHAPCKRRVAWETNLSRLLQAWILFYWPLYTKVCRHSVTITAKHAVTRLSSNPRPTTHACVHLVTRGYFRSRDKDDSHTIQSAIAENHAIHANLIALWFIEAKLLPMEVLHRANKDFRHFLLPWKAGMVHSVSGWTRGVQVKLWDPLRMRAIPERLRGVFTTEALYKYTFTLRELDLDLMTFIYNSQEIYLCEKINFVRQGFRKLSDYSLRIIIIIIIKRQD